MNIKTEKKNHFNLIEGHICTHDISELSFLKISFIFQLIYPLNQFLAHRKIDCVKPFRTLNCYVLIIILENVTSYEDLFLVLLLL